MLVLLLMVLVVWKLVHGPELFDLQVAFIVSAVLLSHTRVCSVGMGHMFVVVLAGVSVLSCSHGTVLATI